MRRTASATFGLLLAVVLPAGFASAQGAAPAAQANTAAPAGPTPAQVHLGHLLTKFVTVPGNQGLVTVAVADARVAIQHAELGMRDPNNLQAMKTHANHIIHALD